MLCFLAGERPQQAHQGWPLLFGVPFDCLVVCCPAHPLPVLTAIVFPQSPAKALFKLEDAADKAEQDLLAARKRREAVTKMVQYVNVMYGGEWLPASSAV
jgi:hypothetical protein